MTTTKMRRGKRSLAAILAAMLMASVLAVVAGSPAQAANTSLEVLVDHDNNEATEKVREFAGVDRYDTALRLAKNFAMSKGGLGGVPVVFVASGNTLVDSIAAAGFAGYVDAPILLTPTGSLHGGVADFIEDYGVSTVYVLGGTAAVDDATVTAIEGLNNKPTVTRFGGDDRYATAAAVAEKIDVVSSWCGTDVASAMLINGGTDMLAYGVAAQTTAYRLQLPLLMTTADELPDSTAEFISENDIEHVQIMGGTGTVSADVASALTSLGVDTVARVDGGSASEVSVELAKLANNGCNDDLAPVSTDHVVLVRGNPDGVAAAPVLASTLANGALVTPLIVGGFTPADSLPASVRDYLAATPQTTATGDKLQLGIVAVGGTAAISESVMDAAIEAAASEGELTVAIAASAAMQARPVPYGGDTNGDGVVNADDPVMAHMVTSTASSTAAVVAGEMGTAGGSARTLIADTETLSRISLYFSDDVAIDDSNTAASPSTLQMLQDIVYVNGVAADVVAVVPGMIGGQCTNRRLDVVLGEKLTAGDTISVVSHPTHKFGTNKDQRIVQSATTTVLPVPLDRVRPAVEIIGISNQTEATSPAVSREATFYVRISDVGTGLAAGVTLDAGDFQWTHGTGATEITALTFGAGTATTVSGGEVTITGGTRASFTVTPTRAAGGVVTTADTLAIGDRLTLKAGVVKDRAKPRPNLSAATSGTAIPAQASPRVVSVQMSQHGNYQRNVWNVPAAAVGENAGFADADAAAAHSEVTITAKVGGDADGAFGNAWSFLFDTANTYDKTKATDIDVRVDAKGKRVSVRFVNGRATVGDLLAALSSNSAFSSRFVALTQCPSETVPRPERTALVLNTTDADRDVTAHTNLRGRTRFAIHARFNSYIRTLADNTGANAGVGLRADILEDTRARNDEATVAALLEKTAPGSGFLETAGTIWSWGAPGTTVRYEFEVSSAAYLPLLRDVVKIDAGHAGDTRTGAGFPGAPDPEPASIPVSQQIAGGYAHDKDHDPDGKRDAIDEDRNGASQVRISQSNSVPVPSSSPAS